jgi:hypothetical protein
MSTIAESPAAPAPRNVNLRTFLAGGTATTALIAGAIILFASLATYVAFDQLGGGEEADSTATVPAVEPAGAPEAAAAGAGGAGAAVAATPAADTAVAPAPVIVASTPQVPDPTRDGGPSGDPDVVRTLDPPNSPTGTPAAQTGALGGTVTGLEGTAGELGITAPLGDLAKPISGPLDETINDTLNNVGGLLGNPDLGDQVARGVNETTAALLGPGGLADRLLNGNR